MSKIKVIFLCLICTRFAVADGFDCKSGTNELLAILEPLSYTCDAGYFLPADTLGCQPCPVDYTCNGGTFTFNENDAQGIKYSLITTTVSNACAVNFPDDMVAVFIPNETITVNFQNGEDTETVTCTYDTEFTLPEPPTRIGYTFTGWKVKTNE